MESTPVEFRSKTGTIQYYTGVPSQGIRQGKIQTLERKNITVITEDYMLI